MAEIDRVNSAINGFFDSSGKEQIEALGKAMERCLMATERRYMELGMDDDNLLVEINSIRKGVNDLVAALPKDKDDAKQSFREIAKRAMVTRRATYPLENPDAPWARLTPEEALLDDNDAYAFAIFDTLAEDISTLQPALYQLAIEGDWDGDDLFKSEEASESPESTTPR